MTALVDAILAEAKAAGASDVHLRPAAESLEMDWRLDGVLQHVATLPAAVKANVVARLKVIAGLLTYHADRPQEGRLRFSAEESSESLSDGVEMRLSVVPTVHGEKAVVRLFVGSGRYRQLGDLGLPDDVRQTIGRALAETGGVLLISGPAGSGKTTTAYAAMRELASVSKTGNSSTQAVPLPIQRRSLVSLEDPIEAVLPEVAQSQVNPQADFMYAAGLKALLRQDPEVILVGEIRDAETAAVVFQASLTGHLVLTTFHAGSAAEAVSRLLDMQLEPYQLRSGLLAVLNQRLVRTLCECAVWSDRPEDRLGLDVNRSRVPVGCEACGGAGYAGRRVLAELLLPGHSETGGAILERADANTIEAKAMAAGMISHRQRVIDAVTAGLTSAEEVRRTFGFGR
ncbi:MAG: Flp pilus assembly complex ATPase component TadA [Planctomycetota bacterium]|nr:Flp pilus assembly complex ATPase component TadA [Planctomycetaceae bacterium]MDQ3329536.1 Flp pilus assembly complex ATPase component TadA [Planctomycetota bacterium]